MTSSFFYQTRVYTDDTDCSGIVYHANYLKWMEHARTEWLDYLGLSLKQLAQDGFLFVVRTAHLEYLKPARLNDTLNISCPVLESTRTQLLFQQDISSAQDKHCIFVQGRIKLVCVTPELKPTRIPETLMHALGEHT